MSNPQKTGVAPKPKATESRFVNPAPRLEYPKTDWDKMEWSEVGSRALSNLPSSAWNAIKGLNPVNMATGTGALIVGVLRKLGARDDLSKDVAYQAALRGGPAWDRVYRQFNPYAPGNPRGLTAPAGRKFPSSEQYRQQIIKQRQASAEAGAQAENMLNDLYKMYGKRYGSMAGFKEALATDPLSVIMDVNTASRTAGAGARLANLGKTAKVIDTVSKVTDPFALPIQAAKTTAKVAGKTVGLVRKVPENKILLNGKFTPAAVAALKGAFPNLTQADLANPTLQRAMVETMRDRGITPAAAKQALATHHNITIPTSRLTGKAPVRAPSAPRMNQATKEAQAGIEAGVEKNFPHKNEDIGIRLKEAEANARDKVDQQYTAARQITGEFDPAAAQVIETNINDAIRKAYPQYKSANLPENTFPQGMLVIDDFRVNLPKEAGEHGLTMGLLDDKRHGILKRYRGDNAAAGRDRHLLGVIQEGFDNGIEASIQQGLFNGDSSKLLDTWGKARAENRNYRNNFSGTDRFGNPDIVSQALAMADKGNFDKAGSTLINGMFDPQTGTMLPDAPRAWEQIHTVDPNLGAAVDSGVRRKVADQVATGKIDVPEANKIMTTFDTGTKSAFSPEQQSAVRQFGTLKSTLDTTPEPRKDLVKDVLKGGLEAGGVGGLLGMTASGMTGLPPSVTIPALTALEAGARTKIANVRGPSAELSGVVPAERARPYGEAIPSKLPMGAEVPAQVGIRQQQAASEAERQRIAQQNVGPTTQIVAPGTPTGDVEETMSVSPAPAAQPAGIDEEDLVIGDVSKIGRATGGRVGYASGGKIKKASHEELVQRLINKAKHAKRQTDNTTKPLLNVDDSAIVKALSVAQQGV